MTDRRTNGIPLSALRPVLDAEGPLATVYLQAGEAGADAEEQVRLRWKSLSSQLSQAGADGATLAALEDAILVDDITAVQAEGRVLAANRDGVLLNERWDATGDAGDRASLGPDADLGGYLRELARSVRALVVVASKEGATLQREVLTPAQVLEAVGTQNVTGSATESVHKPRGNWLEHKRIQRTADEAATQNIRDVVARLVTTAEDWHPDVLVIGGEVQGRSRLREELPPALQEIAEEVETGGGIPGGGADAGTEQALSDAVEDVAERLVEQRDLELTNRFEEARAAGRTAEGGHQIRDAVQLGAVDTLLLRPDRPGEDESELLRAAAEVDASVALLDADLNGDIAAILRFQVAAGAAIEHP